MAEYDNNNEKKQHMVLVVEGTAALAPYWPTICSDYLHKIIRSFCGIVTTEATTLNVELALVIFSTHNSYSSCFIQRSSWTKNVNLFLEWLSAIHFSGGSFCDAAIADGLSEALMMFSSPNGSPIQQNDGLQRHCVLVAASNPYSLPTPVYRPPDKSEMRPESCLSDAKTVAKSFPQSCVSLSVICPRQLPELKAIYNAGKRDPSAAEPSIDTVIYPHYMVLISESFMEAWAALSLSKITNLTSNLAVSTGNIPRASVKVEPSTVSGGITSSAYVVQTVASAKTTEMAPHSVGVNNRATNVRLSLQTSKALQSAKSKYVKVWEGCLSGRRRSQSVFITRLEAYQRTPASGSLAEDWPSTLQINRLTSEDHMNNKNYIISTDPLVFRAMDQHKFLSQLQEKKLCAVLYLPSQTMLLSVSDKERRLLGMLFYGGKVF